MDETKRLVDNRQQLVDDRQRLGNDSQRLGDESQRLGDHCQRLVDEKNIQWCRSRVLVTHLGEADRVSQGGVLVDKLVSTEPVEEQSRRLFHHVVHLRGCRLCADRNHHGAAGAEGIVQNKSRRCCIKLRQC